MSEWIELKIKCVVVYLCIYNITKRRFIWFSHETKTFKNYDITANYMLQTVFFISLPFSMMIITTFTFRLLCLQSLCECVCGVCMCVFITMNRHSFIYLFFMHIRFVWWAHIFSCVCVCTIGITTCLFNLIESIQEAPLQSILKMWPWSIFFAWEMADF